MNSAFHLMGTNKYVVRKMDKIHIKHNYMYSGFYNV